MRAITTLLLRNSLSTIIEVIEQTSDLDPALPGLLEFKTALTTQLDTLQHGEQLEISNEHTCPA